MQARKRDRNDAGVQANERSEERVVDRNEKRPSRIRERRRKAGMEGEKYEKSTRLHTFSSFDSSFHFFFFFLMGFFPFSLFKLCLYLALFHHGNPLNERLCFVLLIRNDYNRECIITYGNY